MKIYTRSGDKGKTSLLGGNRVLKSHLRIEACGMIDELNAFIGMVHDLERDEGRKDILLNIQKRLFSVGSALAASGDKPYTRDLAQEDVTDLEKAIDAMDATLPEMKYFILPGGHPRVSHCHIARSVCRRAERRVIALNEEAEVPEMVIKYLNRLSDFLFVLARKTGSDLGVKELPWHPRD